MKKFLKELFSDSGMISSKRFITVIAAVMFFFAVIPADMIAHRAPSADVLDVLEWVILGGMGIVGATNIASTMASKKGSNTDKTNTDGV